MADLSFDDLIPQQPSGGSKELDFGDLVPKAEPEGRFRGGYKRQVREAFERPAVKPAAPTGEELKEKWKDVAVGTAQGLPAGVLGLPGDIEALGRLPLKPFGVSQETFVPTSGDIATKFFGEAETPQQAGGRALGSFLSGSFAPGAISKAGSFIKEGAIGRPSIRGAKVAAEAEAEGLPVAARQVRGKEPIGEPLSLKEQEKINEEVSKITGASTKSIDPEFVQGRIDSLGKTYNKIYEGEFNIGENVAAAAKAIAQEEAAIGAAGDAGVASIARNIFGRWNKAREDAEALAQQQQIMQVIKGQQTAMKRGTGAPAGSGGEVVIKKFGPGERVDAAPLTDDLLRAYNAGDHTNVRPITAADAPAWASDVNKVLTELTENLGLRVRPGIYVGNGAGSYGWAHPYGHIFLNEKLLTKPKDALATALHEFGHVVEFQLFEQAPPALKKAINEAWAASKVEGKGKTVEQLRPISADKYGPEHKGMIPKTAKDKEYYLGFKEWYAEQVSRWLTTKQQPITIVDKFFKGVADTWKKIYEKVTGYLPMAQTTDEFMKLNWNGKLINEETTLKIFQALEQPKTPTGVPIGGTVDTAKNIALSEPVIAKIDGKDLQRLRSYISNRAANHPDGNVRFQARRVLKQIDDAIEQTNPAKKALLQDTNKKYRATLTLRDLQKGGDASLNAGNISPQTLGRAIQADGYELTHPLSKYGQYGNVLRMRSATQGPEYSPDPIRSLLSRGGRVIRYLGGPLTPLYESAQRRFQRKMTPGAPPEVTPGYGVPAAAAAGRTLPTPEER